MFVKFRETLTAESFNKLQAALTNFSYTHYSEKSQVQKYFDATLQCLKDFYGNF